MLNYNFTTTPSEIGIILKKEGIGEQVNENVYKKFVASLRHLFLYTT